MSSHIKWKNICNTYNLQNSHPKSRKNVYRSIKKGNPTEEKKSAKPVSRQFTVWEILTVPKHIKKNTQPFLESEKKSHNKKMSFHSQIGPNQEP